MPPVQRRQPGQRLGAALLDGVPQRDQRVPPDTRPTGGVPSQVGLAGHLGQRRRAVRPTNDQRDQTGRSPPTPAGTLPPGPPQLAVHSPIGVSSSASSRRATGITRCPCASSRNSPATATPRRARPCPRTPNSRHSAPAPAERHVVMPVCLTLCRPPSKRPAASDVRWSVSPSAPEQPTAGPVAPPDAVGTAALPARTPRTRCWPPHARSSPRRATGRQGRSIAAAAG